jgi:phosphocarrier protein FPr
VKIRLPDALHARPAALLVRLASRLDASIEVRCGQRRANAKNIVEVLALSATKGSEIELHTAGQGAESALVELVTLIERNFDQDLVPEHGASAVEGVAIGRTVVLPSAPDEAESTRSPSEELVRIEQALTDVRRDVSTLVKSLPIAEARLFEPELAILRDLADLLRAKVQRGTGAEEAVRAVTEVQTTDLLLDARVRLLRALRGDSESLDERLALVDGDVIVVAEELTPSLVARLPKRVVGLVAAGGDDAEADVADGGKALFTSHAALLARGRGLPLVLVPAHLVATMQEAIVAIDTTEVPAQVWVDPGPDVIARAVAKRDARDHARRTAEKRAVEPLHHLSLAVRANVGSIDEELPAAAEGIGLVRTELVFAADHVAPTESRQVAVLALIGTRARGAPVVVRLYDAGGDKPLPWLPPPPGDPDARGVALLLAHEGVLRGQLAALGHLAQTIDVRALIPLVRSAEDVDLVRRAAPSALPIGAMIETKEAVLRIDEIVAASDFVSIGTNDLTASLLGVSRERAAMAPTPTVLRAVAKVIERARAAGKKVTVCGELAGDIDGARLLVGFGADGISVAIPRLSELKLALSGHTLDDCRRAAREALARADGALE